MSSWVYNSTVTFRNGRVERKELIDKDGCPSFLDADTIVERENTGGPLHVPGIKVSVNFERPAYIHFSHGFGLWRQERLCRAEITILQLINDITEKKDWHINVNDFSVCQTWREEAFTSYLANYPASTLLWEWCIFELRKKAEEYIAMPRSVIVLDSASCVSKSNRLLGTEMIQKLEQDSRGLTISPWLYPFIYGRSPVRTDGVSVTLENVPESISKGAIPTSEYWEYRQSCGGERMYYSKTSQWLATDVKFTGQGDAVRIVSPINNLDPAKHRSIYDAVESLISDSITDWNQTLLYKALARGVSRIKPQLYQCSSCFEEGNTSCSCKIEFREYSAWVDGKLDNTEPNTWREAFWNPVTAMDAGYTNSKKIYDNISLSKGFEERGLQVYVEIFCIDIAEDGSVSEESSRHLEWDLNGNRNERIVITTLLCLHRENIHPVSGGISFRAETKRNTWEEPGRKKVCTSSDAAAESSTSAAATPAAVESEGPMMPSFQQLGTIKLPQGRTITFPNALQHKFIAPLLNDQSKPGHIKLLQIHLVDPHYILCSTRHVPPQSLEWWWKASRLDRICLKHKVPNEIISYIIDHTIGPDRHSKGKSPVRSRNAYWRPRFDTDGRPVRPPPIRLVAAMRMRRKALARHAQVMQAVNGPRLYGRPSALEIWLRTLGHLHTPRDRGDPRDLFARPIPDAPPSGEAVGDAGGSQAANGGEDDGAVEGREEGAVDGEEDVEEEEEEEEEDEEEEDNVEEEDGEGEDSEFVESEDEAQEDNDGDGDGNGDGDEGGNTEVDGNAAGEEGAEAAEAESAVDEEFHDAVFYYLIGENDEMEAQEALGVQAQPAEQAEDEDIFYNAAQLL